MFSLHAQGKAGAQAEMPVLTAHYHAYVRSGVDAVEAFAIMSNKEASAYFDRVLEAGLLRGEQCRLAAKIFVKEIWYSVSRDSYMGMQAITCEGSRGLACI
jgi:hypothetical protein